MANPVTIKDAMVGMISGRLQGTDFGNVDVVYGLPDGQTVGNRDGWVSVMGVDSSSQGETFAASLDRYRITWSIRIDVGSGYQTSPREAEKTVFDLVVEVAAALETDHTLGLGTQGVESTSLEKNRTHNHANRKPGAS